MSITVLGLSADRLPLTLMEHPHRCLTTSRSTTSSTPLTTSSGSPSRTSRADPLDGIDPSFVFDFRAYDDLDDGQRWSTWYDVEPLCRGPEPRPDWVVTSRGAIDTELGILKTGKEADVFLLERADPGSDPDGGRRDGRQALPQHRAPQLPPRGGLHRGPQHQALPRRARPQAQEHLGQDRRRRRVGDLGVGRAQALLGARAAGPLPGADRRHRDPDGVDHRATARPHRGWPRPGRSRRCWRRTSSSSATRWPRWSQHGLVHGDLSAYNILAAGERLVIIDLPQIVDLVGNAERDGLPDARLRQRLRLVPGARARGRRARAVRGADGARVLTPAALGCAV